MGKIKINYYGFPKNTKKLYLSNKDSILIKLSERKNEIYQRLLSGERRARIFNINDNISVKDIKLYENALVFSLSDTVSDYIVCVFEKEIDYIFDEDNYQEVVCKLKEEIDMSIFQLEENNFFYNLINKNKKMLKEEQKKLVKIKIELFLDVLGSIK